jgi:putative flavoprotein involved in K+ transport
VHLDTIIIGAGQAGLALSHHLRAAGHQHALLERGRVGERWRSERWDSLRVLTPNWLNGLPGAAPLPEPHGYLDREGVIAHLEAYAADAPVHEGTTVLGVRRIRHGYHVSTDRGDWHASSVVIATGDCAVPYVPAAAPASVHALPVTRYRRPEALPGGPVLVVGSGPSGQQIAAELRRAGRDVALAVGRHTRVPRSYRGRDVFAWLHDLGQLTTHVDDLPDPAAARKAPSFPVSGARGGESLGLDRLAELGVTICGRFERFDGVHAVFAGDLPHQVSEADRRMRRTLAQIDAHIERTGTAAAPADPLPPVTLGRGPERLAPRTVVWATGFRRSYPWLHVPVLDAAGEIVQHEGVTPSPGLYTLGLRLQRTRGSHLLGGVGADAARLAETIAGRPRLVRAA